jgi:hypothetical protein
MLALSLFGETIVARATDENTNWVGQLQQWQTEHAAALTTPDGWFTVVGLEWLKPGENTFGTSADSRIRLHAPGSAQFGIIDVEPGSLFLKPPKGGFPADLKVDEHPAREQALIVDGRNPTKLTDGTLTLFVIRRGDSLALRVKDSEAPARLAFRGLRWYAPNRRYRIEAEWIPFQKPKPVVVQNVVGTTSNGLVFGEARFTLDGQQIGLQAVVQDDKAKSLLFVIRDATSGRSTYAASRFLHTSLPDHGLREQGKLLLDFNRLENPPCAFTPYATCPLPPASNRLKVALAAGELKYSH